MNGRIVVISDLHLGRSRHAARSAEALRPLWQGAAHLIVNGDVAEVHHPVHWATAARETLKLFDMCETDGVELTLLSGNHDPYISDLRHLHLANHEVFITHGDVLHPAVAPWSLAAGRIREANEKALAALDPEDRDRLEGRLNACQHASYAEWQNIKELQEQAAHSTLRGMLVRPWALVRVLAYWRAFPKLAAAFAEKHAPAARFVLVGHTHRPGIWSIKGRIIVNTGSYGFPGRPLGVVLDDGWLRVMRISARGELYAFDAALGEYSLNASEHASPGQPSTGNWSVQRVVEAEEGAATPFGPRR